MAPGGFGLRTEGYGVPMANLPRRRRSPLSRRLALLGAPVIVLGVVACGDMEPPKDTLSPGATTEAGSPSGEVMPTTGSTGSSLSAVIGAWAARYGSARNDVQTALATLGSSSQQGAAAVKKAAADALAALKSADAVPPCPDDATESAYRSAIDDLTAKVTAVKESGDAAAAQQAATDGSTAFDATEQDLLAVYG